MNVIPPGHWRVVLALLGVLGLSWRIPALGATSANPPPGAVGGVIPRLGTNLVGAGRWLSFKAPLNAYARTQMGRIGTNVSWVSAALVLPEQWDRQPRVPIAVICASSGASAVGHAHEYSAVALTNGWAVLAVDGPALGAGRETAQWDWGIIASALDYFRAAVPRARTWPIALAGFSGGAKKAACLAPAAAAARQEVWGVFMGGCNEDNATLGVTTFTPGPSFFLTPMFLSNGVEDPIAGPSFANQVRASLEAAGFKRLRPRAYSGGHRLDPDQFGEALQWFRESTPSASIGTPPKRPATTR